MRSVCFKNLHYQGVFWPPPRAWPSNSAQHFGSPCLLDFFYRFVEFDNFFLKIWARLEIFCFELLIFCYGLKFLKLHKGAACAQLVRARVQLVRTRAQLVRARAQLVRARAQLVRSINSIQVNFCRRCSPMSSAVRRIDALLSRSLATWKLESVIVDGRRAALSWREGFLFADFAHFFVHTEV